MACVETSEARQCRERHNSRNGSLNAQPPEFIMLPVPAGSMYIDMQEMAARMGAGSSLVDIGGPSSRPRPRARDSGGEAREVGLSLPPERESAAGSPSGGRERSKRRETPRAARRSASHSEAPPATCSVRGWSAYSAATQAVPPGRCASSRVAADIVAMAAATTTNRHHGAIIVTMAAVAVVASVGDHNTQCRCRRNRRSH